MGTPRTWVESVAVQERRRLCEYVRCGGREPVVFPRALEARVLVGRRAVEREKMHDARVLE